MPNIIFAAVDGTGADDNAEYAAAMANSFVNNVYHRCRASGTDKYYHRGPTLLGMETGPQGAAAARFVVQRRGNVTDPKVVLSGYSRGGAAVITAAQILGVQGITVDVLVLFDAVDRSITAMAGIIPPNVSTVYHVRRSPWAMSRPYFGNCGTSCVPLVTTYSESFFNATHGGVGGCPWWNQPGRAATTLLSDRIYEDGVPTRVTYEQDLDGSRAAWNWVAPFLSTEGIL